MEIMYVFGKIIITTIERDEFGESYNCDRQITIDDAIRLRNELEKAIEEAENDRFEMV